MIDGIDVSNIEDSVLAAILTTMRKLVNEHSEHEFFLKTTQMQMKSGVLEKVMRESTSSQRKMLMGFVFGIISDWKRKKVLARDS
jgi:membrane protease subunit (stomatin/prohibitin family)